LQSALGHDHVEDLSKHSSQVDAAKGFGGKFGVQKDRVDKVGHGIPIDTYISLLTLALGFF
jgi:cortactin